MSLQAGTRIGPYDIVSPLGAGGMGEVYRARDTKLGRDVALKILPEALKLDADRLARFEREARLLASLNHPHIGAIYGVDDSAGVRALVLELVEGPTLADKLAAGPLPLGDALALAGQIADALDAAHERGIVHRDLKPANIKITSDGVVKVLDFGLAKEHEAGGAGELTHSPTVMGPSMDGVLLGTAPYMSPEQARGRAIDKRTDVWAFGCVLFEMLTGRRAFPGETMADALAAILERDPDWSALPPEVPTAVHRLLRRCLEKDPKRRLRDIGDARADLADRDDAGAPRSSAGADRRMPTAWLAIGALTLAATAAAAWWAGARSTAAGVAPPRIARALRLTNTPGAEYGAAVAPDGKWVAYYANPENRPDLWVRFLDSGAALNLTKSLDLSLQAQPGLGGLDISPDGTMIAFTARQTAAGNPPFDTWVIPAPVGGAPRKLLTGLTAMRWSPDGKRLVCMRAGATLGDSLIVAGADGSNPRVIVPQRGGRHLHWPAWSRNGKYIYFINTFITWHDEPSQIYRVAVDGGEPEPVVRASRRAIYPVPMPDGSLIFAANPSSVEAGLWWQPTIGAPAQPLTTGVGEHTEAYLSGDGRRLATTLSDLRQAIVQFPADGSGDKRAITDGYSGDLHPAIHARSGRMVFSSSRAGSRNIWMARADGTQAVPLTSENVNDERPAFSPAGDQVAFISDRSGRQGIWVISAEGGSARLVGAADVLDTLTWSPDGKRILFAVPGGTLPQLAAIGVDDARIVKVPTPAAAHSPVWSAATNRVAYLEPTQPTATTPSRTYIAFMDADGKPLFTGMNNRTAHAFQNGVLEWSPDGRRVAAISAQTNTRAAIWIIDPEAPDPFRLVAELPVWMRLRGITWTADGTGLVVAQQEARSDIVLFDLVK